MLEESRVGPRPRIDDVHRRAERGGREERRRRRQRAAEDHRAVVEDADRTEPRALERVQEMRVRLGHVEPREDTPPHRDHRTVPLRVGTRRHAHGIQQVLRPIPADIARRPHRAGEHDGLRPRASAPRGMPIPRANRCRASRPPPARPRARDAPRCARAAPTCARASCAAPGRLPTRRAPPAPPIRCRAWRRGSPCP